MAQNALHYSGKSCVYESTHVSATTQQTGQSLFPESGMVSCFLQGTPSFLVGKTSY